MVTGRVVGLRVMWFTVTWFLVVWFGYPSGVSVASDMWDEVLTLGGQVASCPDLRSSVTAGLCATLVAQWMLPLENYETTHARSWNVLRRARTS